MAAATALVTGVGGQDGVYLARHLRSRGVRVVGTVEPGGLPPGYVAAYLRDVELVEHDVRDAPGFARLLESWAPGQVYNLAAFSSVGASFDHRELVEQTNAEAVRRMLECLVERRGRHGEAPRFFQASSSEMFAGNPGLPWTESSTPAPLSPYGAAKRTAHEHVASFRESQGLFACSGILFNHESPLRGSGFVTRKITRGAAEIALGRRDCLELGNLDVRRDWGAAADHVRAMALMLSGTLPRDFVVATGVAHSLGELLDVAFAAAGLGPPSSYVVQDPALIRPSDVPETRGDATGIREQLGWQPTVTFEEMVTQMVRVDLERLRTGVEDSRAYL